MVEGTSPGVWEPDVRKDTRDVNASKYRQLSRKVVFP